MRRGPQCGCLVPPPAVMRVARNPGSSTLLDGLAETIAAAAHCRFLHLLGWILVGREDSLAAPVNSFGRGQFAVALLAAAGDRLDGWVRYPNQVGAAVTRSPGSR
jgi:hypothetical protein